MTGRGDGGGAPGGLTPQEWERRLEETAHDPARLAATLAEMDEEIRREHTFLHEDPEPDTLISMVLDFLGIPEDDDYEGLGRRIEQELAAERWLKERYRTWIPGETVLDLIFPYVKNFGADVREDGSGLQFPGFRKFKGLRWGRSSEAFTLYISERYPGREPANFHLLYDPPSGGLVIKRVYRKELPRIGGISTPSRAVLAEMALDIVPSLRDVRALVVDNAANLRTRDALLARRGDGGTGSFEVREEADPSRTPLGNLMVKLARELGLAPGAFGCHVGPYGLLRMVLPVRGEGDGEHQRPSPPGGDGPVTPGRRSDRPSCPP